jgi:HSP20 family molecular chaperone IbpA
VSDGGDYGGQEIQCDAEKASAVFEHGVLEIRLPKAEEAKSKRIEVK